MRSKCPGRYSICQLSSVADLLALPAAARAGPLFPAQLVDLRGHRQILEVDQRPPSRPPLHPPPLGRGLTPHGHILRLDRFLLQFLAEVQQRLRQLSARLQPVRARPVIPLLVALQLQLQTQRLHVEIVGALPLLRRQRRLFPRQGFLRFRVLLLAVALGPRRKQQRLQRRGVFRQGDKRWVRGRHITLDVAIRMWLHTSRFFCGNSISADCFCAACYRAPRW